MAVREGKEKLGECQALYIETQNGIDLFYWEIPVCLPDKRIRIVTLVIELMKSIVRIME
jgi:hypothetical protein